MRAPLIPAAVVACAAILAAAPPARAQELSLAVAVDGTSYQGRPYELTNGDRAIELAFGYELQRGIRLAAGVFVGKFDEPVSDSSLTAVSVFVEPQWVLRRAARVRIVVGPRLAWEQQRAGSQSDGLWAFGWGFGGTAGVLVRLGEPVSVGVRTVLTGLQMEREDGTSRDGLRVQVGGTFVLTWPIR